MFHLIPIKMKNNKKIKTEFLYSCVFNSDKGPRYVRVIAPTFGVAASTAYDASSVWEDVDDYELISIHLLHVVSLKSNV